MPRPQVLAPIRQARLLLAIMLLGVLAVLLMPFDAARVIRYALPFSAGVTLYIVASDLIPEITRRREHGRFAPLAIICGVLLFYLLHEIMSH